MPELRAVSKKALKEELHNRPHYNSHQSGYLIDNANFLFRLSIYDEAVFKKLMPCTYVIGKDEAPRTLDVVVRRAHERFGGLDGLIQAHPYHDQGWYEKIRTLYYNFSWEHMGPVFVSSVHGARKKGIEEKDPELIGTPSVSFVILSGLHCSLAALFRIHEDLDSFQPVDSVLVVPRIDYPDPEKKATP